MSGLARASDGGGYFAGSPRPLGPDDAVPARSLVYTVLGVTPYVDRVVELLETEARLVELAHFASSYYVGTRLIKPLLARAGGGSVDVANPEMDWNRWCSMLPPAGDYGTQVLFVFEKRER